MVSEVGVSLASLFLTLDEAAILFTQVVRWLAGLADVLYF